MWIFSFLAPFIEQIVFPPVCVLDTFNESQRSISCKFSSLLSGMFHSFVSVLSSTIHFVAWSSIIDCLLILIKFWIFTLIFKSILILFLVWIKVQYILLCVDSQIFTLNAVYWRNYPFPSLWTPRRWGTSNIPEHKSPQTMWLSMSIYCRASTNLYRLGNGKAERHLLTVLLQPTMTL